MAAAISLMQVPIPTVEACEYDHHIIHEAYGDRDIETTISQEKADKIREMMAIAEAQKILEDCEWSNDYNKMVDQRIRKVERNLELMTVQELYEEVEL